MAKGWWLEGVLVQRAGSKGTRVFSTIAPRPLISCPVPLFPAHRYSVLPACRDYIEYILLELRLNLSLYNLK